MSTVYFGGGMINGGSGVGNDPILPDGPSILITGSGTVRSFTDPYSMIGVTGDQLTQMMPDSWTAAPVNKGVGTRWYDPANPNQGSIRYLPNGSPQVGEVLHDGGYVNVRVGAIQYRVAAAGNPAASDPATAVMIDSVGPTGPVDLSGSFEFFGSAGGDAGAAP